MIFLQGGPKFEVTPLYVLWTFTLYCTAFLFRLYDSALRGNNKANRPIYVKTVQFIETLCKGDIVVRDIKQYRSFFSPLQNFQLLRYTLLE